MLIAYEIFEGSINLHEQSKEIIQKSLVSFRKELSSLMKEYRAGSDDDYPPDWYDCHIYPLETAIEKIEDYLYEDSEEDSDF